MSSQEKINNLIFSTTLSY